MPLQLEVGQQFVIEGRVFRAAVDPTTPGSPYARQGEQSTVYQLLAGHQTWALKVPALEHKSPSLAGLVHKIEPMANVPGLQVCHGTVLAPQRHPMLLRQYPDLAYSLLMPWIDGPTWEGVLLARSEVSPEQSLQIAGSLAATLSGMEERNLAHCRLNSANVLLPILTSTGPGAGQAPVELVDIEHIYSPDLPKPRTFATNSPGYASPHGDDIWGEGGDRFAGAVLLAEMFAWCNEQIREIAWGGSYFEPGELGRDGARFRLLSTVLRELWSEEIAQLFERAWSADRLSSCPSFAEWLAALPQAVPIPSSRQISHAHEIDDTDTTAVVALLDLAKRLERDGNLAGALAAYTQVQAVLPTGSALSQELEVTIQDLESRLQTVQAAALVAASYAPPTTPMSTYTGPFSPTIAPSSAPLPPSHTQQRRVWTLAPLLVLLPILALLAIGGFWGVATLRAQQNTAQAQATATTRAIKESIASATTVALIQFHAYETATAQSEEGVGIATSTTAPQEAASNTPLPPTIEVFVTVAPSATTQPLATNTPEPRFGPAGIKVPVKISASSVAPPSIDSTGNITTYDPAHAVDGQRDTAWRVPGDGLGHYLLLEFASPVRIAQVGLIPGYAKVDPATHIDRFYQNRRVVRVRFEFDDGSSTEANFQDRADMQFYALARPVTSRTIRIIVEETRPSTNPDPRDFTPISEIQVIGEEQLP